MMLKQVDAPGCYYIGFGVTMGRFVLHHFHMNVKYKNSNRPFSLYSIVEYKHYNRETLVI